MTVETHALEALKHIIHILRMEGFSWPLLEKKLRMRSGNGMTAWRGAGYQHPKGPRSKQGSSVMTEHRREVLKGALQSFGGIIRILKAEGYSWREIEVFLKLRYASGNNAQRISKIKAAA